MLSLNKYMFQRQHLSTTNTCLLFLLLPLSLVRAVILIWFSIKTIELWLYRMGNPPCNVWLMLYVLLIKKLEWSQWLQSYSHMAGHQPFQSVSVKPLVGLIALFMLYIDLPATRILFCWPFLASVFTQTYSSEVQHNNRFRTTSSISSFLQWKVFAMFQPLNAEINTYTKYLT